MSLTSRKSSGISVINASARLTGVERPGELKALVSKKLAAGDRKIVLNLSQVAFADSAFIGELMSCYLAVARVGGVLKLASPVRRVQDLLRMTRLITVIESFDKEGDALESFTKPAN